MMNKIAILTIQLLLLSFTGCLEFGEELETTSPTKAQIEQCRSEMYLNSSVKITPLGYKLSASGIDDAIWFKFKTESAELAEIFDSKIVDASKFKDDSGVIGEIKGLKWWDVKGRKLFGGQVSLPNARYMNVGIEKTDEGCLVYIMWHET